jgi:hypothetical protein
MPFHEKRLRVIALIITCLLLPSVSAAPIYIEQTMSFRYSVNSWTTQNIPQQQLLEVLRGAYGYWQSDRSIPQIGNDYSLVLYPVNDTGTYQYIPEQNTLVIQSLTVTKATIAAHITQSYVATANTIIIVVWNQTRMNNQYYASAEAGLLVQNAALSAITLNLGTHCVALIDSNGLRGDLGLASSMTPLLVLPLGYDTSPFSSASPDYTRMTGNLPRVQYSQMSFADSLNSLLYAQAWSDQALSTQELSQLLWAAYGYSTTGHRTVPSAVGIYPLKIYVSNATGIYAFTPELHSVTAIAQGDKRLEIASACGDETWVANAPTIFIVAYDSSLGGDGGIVPHEWIEVDAGCVVQQILLEASAWTLSGNIVSKGLENWNGAGAGTIRTILSLPSSFIPLYVVPVGHGGVIPEFSLFLILPVFMISTLIAVTLCKMQHWTRDRRKEF